MPKPRARPVVKTLVTLPEKVIELSDLSDEDVVGVRNKTRANGKGKEIPEEVNGKSNVIGEMNGEPRAVGDDEVIERTRTGTNGKGKVKATRTFSANFNRDLDPSSPPSNLKGKGKATCSASFDLEEDEAQLDPRHLASPSPPVPVQGHPGFSPRPIR